MTVSNGKIWQETRKFMMGQLSNLGMGKGHNMKDIIEQEAQDFCSILKSKITENNVINVNGMFMTATNNVIWRTSTGKGHKQTDPHTKNLTMAVTKFFQALEPGNLKIMS